MVFWLVTAKPRVERLGELKRRLDSREISRMRPFGRSLENGLVNAKLREDGTALWEEEDYCVPPLAQERAAILDDYFDNLTVEDIGDPGRGWKKLTNLPSLWHRDVNKSASSRWRLGPAYEGRRARQRPVNVGFSAFHEGRGARKTDP